MEPQQESESLFGDVLEEAGIMPAKLEKYDRTITQKETQAAGDQMLIQWIKRAHDGVVNRLGTTTEVRLPCSSLTIIEKFFPDFPEVEDYAAGEKDQELMLLIAEADPKFQRLTVKAEIDMARAKRACWEECQVRTMCLAQAIEVDAEYAESGIFRLHDNYSVRGGWGPGALQAIANRFHKQRRDYTSGKMPEAERESMERAADLMRL